MARILILEDELTLRTVLSEALRDEGHEVHDTDDGALALAHMHGWLPDLVLMDLMMPKMTGESFGHLCRETPAFATIPLVILSAARDIDLVAQRVHAAAVLPKPYDLDDVFATVERLTAPAAGPAIATQS